MLQLSRHARVIPVGPDTIFWLTETRQGCWTAPHAGEIASLLAAPTGADSILERFPGAAAVLDGLLRRGLIESGSVPPALAQLCREWGISPQLEERKRWREGVTIVDFGLGPEAKALESALGELSVPVRESAGLRVAIAADYLDPRLEQLPQESPWILAQLAGEEIRIGPIFGPGQAACWRCLQPRLRENSWLRSQLPAAIGPWFEPSTSEGRLLAAAEMAAGEIARWLLEAPGALESVIWSFSWATLESRRHAVRPGCPAHPPMPPTGAAGSRRPSEVLDRLEPLSSPITGIVRRLERRDLVPSPPVFTYGSVHNPALPPDSVRMPGVILQPGICSGRGWSAEEARAACLAEAVERYSQQFRGDERRIQARYRDLGAAAIHPAQLLLFSEAQYALRDEWNRQHSADEAIAEPFNEEEEIEWREGWSLTAREPRFLPMALCSLSYRPQGKRWIGDAGSAGCAAGSDKEEAILHGLLELVEHDALALWWFNRIARPAFEPEAIPDTSCRTVCDRLQQQGWEVWVADITSDFGIPVFAAVASRGGEWIRGSGCRADPSAALRSAVSELWQLSKAPGRRGSPPPRLGRPPACPPPIEDCFARIERAGHDIVIFDLTRPEIGFPVVRVVAPGLRSSKPRFAPGRLYDVPVRLGWLAQSRAEEEFPTQSA